MTESKSLLHARSWPAEIGRDTPWNGWVRVSPQTSGVALAVGNRGIGHDEPSTYHGVGLTREDALELVDCIVAALAGSDG